jgi:heme-degrading monooxygenase HmoA
MIARIWHGYTTLSNADAYEALLREEIFKGIINKNIAGFIRIQLLRRTLAEEVEFITLMHFDHLQAVKDFAGPDYEKAVVPEAAQKLLKRYDAQSQHYQVMNTLQGEATIR